MFRLDEDRVVDATLSGGLARYINHSCNPNCVTEIVEVDREFRIIIFAKRRINRGEEVSNAASKTKNRSEWPPSRFSYRTTTNLTLKTTRIRYPACVGRQIAANG